MSAMKLALGFAVAIALGFALVSSARAQGPDVQIVELQCTGDPELVVIENLGNELQEFEGWTLQSDPPDSEVYDLSVRGAILPGAKAIIQSGPSASGQFLQDKWGLQFIFRDDDPTDYARIVDDTGAVVHQVNCGGEVALEPSPTPIPEPSPVDGVPNGGGPPPPPGGALSSIMMVLVGGSMAAAGVLTGALSWLRRRHSPAEVPASSQEGSAAPRPPAQPKGTDSPRGRSTSAALGLGLVGLLAAAVVLFLLWHREA